MNKIDLNLSKHVEQQRVNSSNDANRAAQAEQSAKPASSASPSEPDAVKVSERAANIGRLAARVRDAGVAWLSEKVPDQYRAVNPPT